MKCPKCQTENLADAAFCEECGAPFESACPACGAGNRPAAKFCRKCRTPLNGAAAPQPRTAIPQGLADKILATRPTLEGERKLVTVLFADVKGSMDLAEQLDPEQWSAIMKRFFAILSEGVERFEGYVDKFTGDGIMALFGAPIAHEDHARRACYAALHLQDELRKYATELRLRYGLNFSARMGLNSGEVIVGRIGDDLRMDYTAQGHTVGLAARMEQIAEPGKVYLTAHTAHELQGYFALQDLGPLQIKGMHQAVNVHELLGLGTARTRMDVSRSRGFSRFVGRGDEMQMLEAALARAREGNGQIVGIVAEAGVGKSRLCYEFLERCRARGLMTLEAAGVAHGKAVPFLPALRLFRAFFGIGEQDSPATARERIAGRLLLLDERLRVSLPLVFEFMGVPDPEQPAPRLDPEARQRQMFDMVRRVNRARSETEVTVALLEDLHWFDAGSEAFLEPVLDSTVGIPGLVILNFRPEYHAPWMNRSNYQQIALGPLGPDAVRELLDALLGRDASLVGLGAAIHRQTAGNPFFVEEIVQSLLESGKLEGNKGAYRLITPIDKLEIPSSVHSLLAARIDRLAQREKDVLQTAAVIGREFDEPTLAAVVEQDMPQLREALQLLKGAEFVREQSLYPVAEYLFKHPLTHEVALASQLLERRRRLHAAVARVVEAAHAGDGDEHAALLAHHWEEAGDKAQAVKCHVRAAEWARNRDPLAGLRHWVRVRELARGLDGAETTAICLRACAVILINGGFRVGMTDDAMQDCLEEARGLARTLGRPAALAVPLGGLGLRLTLSGQTRSASEVFEEARRLLGPDVAPAEVVSLECAYGHFLEIAGRTHEVLETTDRIEAMCAGDPNALRDIVGFSPLIWAVETSAFALARMGRFGECWLRLGRAIRLARAHAPRENLIWALCAMSLLAYLARSAAGAPEPDLVRAAAEAVEIADEFGARFSGIASRLFLGVAHFMSANHEEAELWITAFLERARREGDALEYECIALSVAGDCRLARGDIEAAIAMCREAIERADSQGELLHGALARTVFADALVASAKPDAEIVRVIADARELVDKSGGDSLLPRLLETEARMVGRTNPDLLDAGLRDAEQLYRSMGMPVPADRLARELDGKASVMA